MKLKWDKGISYEYAYYKILAKMKEAQDDKTYAYYAVLLTQLRNGSRVSEAIKAIQLFAKAGRREVEVQVSKKRSPTFRLMVIPGEVDQKRCISIADISVGVLANRVKVICITKLGFNTHSLRYAFITKLLKSGINPAIVAKITEHSKLDFILTYAQKKAAEETLRSIE